MKRKKLKKKLLKAAANLASAQSRAAEYAAVWDEYDDFQKWMRRHAPATLKRYGKDLPRYRPQSMDEMLRYYYTPALREQLNGSSTFFDALNQAT